LILLLILLLVPLVGSIQEFLNWKSTHDHFEVEFVKISIKRMPNAQVRNKFLSWPRELYTRGNEMLPKSRDLIGGELHQWGARKETRDRCDTSSLVGQGIVVQRTWHVASPDRLRFMAGPSKLYSSVTCLEKRAVNLIWVWFITWIRYSWSIAGISIDIVSNLNIRPYTSLLRHNLRVHRLIDL
jgi:hypothetical protein